VGWGFVDLGVRMWLMLYNPLCTNPLPQARINGVFSELHGLWRRLEASSAVTASGRRGAAALRATVNAGDAVLSRVAALDLSASGLSAVDAQTLAAAVLLPTVMPCLEALDLSGNALRDDGVASIAASLPFLTRLSVLRFGSVRLTEASVGTLVAALSLTGAPQLAELSLGGNALGDAGVSALSTGVAAVGRSLRRLDLSGTRLGDAGAVALAAALPGLPRLEALVLRLNVIGDEGIAAVVSALPSLGPHLLTLDVSRNAFAGVSQVCFYPPPAWRSLL
jgi:hypothetical protein